MSASARQAKKRGLGRGLNALLQDEPARSLQVDQLKPNKFQPRTEFDDAKLAELAESIRSQGLVQPIVVTPDGSGAYTIIAGERRWRAAQRAGLKEVPVAIRQVADDREMLELALVENVQRSDLNPVEEAEAYKTLGEKFELSQEEIATRVGKSRSTVANSLRLLNLPGEIQVLLRQGSLTAGQARPLLSIKDRAQQVALAREAVETRLTARDLERRAADARDGQGGGEAETKAKPKRTEQVEEPEIFAAAAQEKLTRKLQTKVEIRRKGDGGTVRIHFHSEEELIRLYDQLMERGET